MPKKNRLSGAEIRRLAPQKRLNGNLFSLSVTPHNSEAAQFSCVVSKKVSLKAVVRNLVKRRMRSVLQQQLHSGDSYAYILQAKPAAAGATFAAIREDVTRLVDRARSNT